MSGGHYDIFTISHDIMMSNIHMSLRHWSCHDDIITNLRNFEINPKPHRTKRISVRSFDFWPNKINRSKTNWKSPKAC